MCKESSELDHWLQVEFAETKEKQMTTEEVWRFKQQEQTPEESRLGAEWSRGHVHSCPGWGGWGSSPLPHHPVAAHP